jgi:Flp pilus assembly protein TadD
MTGLSFTRVAFAKGAAAALDEFSRELASASISEGTVNQAGYLLLGSNKTSDAILMFRKNVEQHPASWNVYDSLGEAYLKNGDKDLAAKNYQKSVELNPTNDNGREALKKLAAQ